MEQMLTNSSAVAVLTADDLERAKTFYTEKLGLRLQDFPVPGIAFFVAGNGTALSVYEKKGAQRPDNTALGFTVQNIEQEVQDLKTRGVVFEHYDFPEFDARTSLITTGPVKTAFFKDSEGNIISLNQV
jgi:catechol 2,3-dioxygenase-like lactoylglutathione lyase family enzyme